MTRFLVLLLVIWLPASSLGAATPEDLGPAVGSKAPHALVSIDQAGKTRSFDDLAGENGLVLMFVRSASWCPFCQRQLKDMQSGLKAIEDRGYKLAALSYDSVETLSTFGAKNEIGYTLLSDPDSEIIKAFDVLNEDIKPGSRAYGIPHPVIFILDRDGVVKAKLYEEGYRTRPPVEAVVEAL